MMAEVSGSTKSPSTLAFVSSSTSVQLAVLDVHPLVFMGEGF